MVLVRVLEHIPTLAYIRDNIHLMCSFTRALANPGDTMVSRPVLVSKKQDFVITLSKTVDMPIKRYKIITYFI